MNGTQDGMMDGSMVVVIVSAVAMLLLWAWIARPDGPDPEDPEEAPQALGEGLAGLFALAVIVVLMVVGVIAL